MSARNRRVLWTDPDAEKGGSEMEFRLTYEGELKSGRDDPKGKARAPDKHRLRMHFHRQLRQLWNSHPTLKELNRHPYGGRPTYVEWASQNFAIGDPPVHFVPLATRNLRLLCKLEVLMLRPNPPGEALSDIDNKLKTVFDALSRPATAQQLWGNASPETREPNEEPIYVLLEDDKLISHVAVETDTLLTPENPGENEVRLVIIATVKPYFADIVNDGFTV